VIGGSTAAAITGTTLKADTSLELATGATVTGIDNGSLGSSATLLATQGAIKTYVDAQVGTVDTLAEVLANGNTTGSTNIIVSASQKITTDTIDETTAAAGVTIDSVLVKDNTVTATTFTGALTGNVTGNVTGSSGSTTGLAATATALATARAINGVDFDGTAAITVTAAAGTLTGTELKSTVVTSSLTSVGTLTSLTTGGNIEAAFGTSSGNIEISGTATSEDIYMRFLIDDNGNESQFVKYTSGATGTLAGVSRASNAFLISDENDLIVGATHASGELILAAGNATAMTIDSSQDVNIPNGGLAIGTTSSPETGLHISKTSSTGLGAQLTLDNPAAAAVGNAVEISFLTDTGADPQSTRNARILAECNNASNGAASLQFHTWDGSASAERMRIQQDGKVGINIDAVGTALLDPSSQMTVKGDVWSLTHSDGGFKVNNHTAGTTGGTLSFFKSRQGNYDPPSAAADDVVNGDTLFSVVGYGYSNSQFSESARMLAQVDGTFTSNQRPPGRFVFQTGVSNGAMTEAMRIDSSQDVNIPNGSLAIGTTTAPAGILDVKDGDTVIAPNSSADNVVISQKSGDCGISILSGNSNCIIAFGDEASADDGAINYIHADRQMSFKAADTSMLWLSSDGFYLGSNVGDNQFRTSSAGGGSTTMYIGNQSITTSSDRRLKTNIVDSSLDAVHALNQLRVTDFNWDDPSDTSFNNRNARGVWTGMIAQEVVEHLPFTVNAPRDEEKVIDYDSDSTWSIEPMAMCGVLVKAIQELSTRIQDLEAQLDG